MGLLSASVQKVLKGRMKRLEADADHSPSSAEANHAWSHNSHSPIRLYGVALYAQDQHYFIKMVKLSLCLTVLSAMP
jgi:hypothetical protein